MKVPYPVIKHALRLAASIVGERWPQDEWHTLNKDWSLNLFRVGPQCKADIAPVVNGVIKSELACPLLHFRAVEYETKDIPSHE